MVITADQGAAIVTCQCDGCGEVYLANRGATGGRAIRIGRTDPCRRCVAEELESLTAATIN